MRENDCFHFNPCLLQTREQAQRTGMSRWSPTRALPKPTGFISVVSAHPIPVHAVWLCLCFWSIIGWFLSSGRWTFPALYAIWVLKGRGAQRPVLLLSSAWRVPARSPRLLRCHLLSGPSLPVLHYKLIALSSHFPQLSRNMSRWHLSHWIVVTYYNDRCTHLSIRFWAAGLAWLQTRPGRPHAMSPCDQGLLTAWLPQATQSPRASSTEQGGSYVAFRDFASKAVLAIPAEIQGGRPRSYLSMTKVSKNSQLCFKTATGG